MIYYLDTSALIKLYYEEQGSDVITCLILDSSHTFWISELTILELVGATARKSREKRFSQLEFERTASRIEHDLYGFPNVFIEPVGSLILANAKGLQKQLGLPNPLRTLDAIQLATFASISEPEWIFVCADTRLLQAAQALHAHTLNPETTQG